MSLVQVAHNTGTSGTSLTVTLGSSTTAGNCLIVCVATNDFTTPPTVSGITLGGSAGNFARANQQNTGGRNNTEIWTDANCAGGQTSVVISLTGDAGGAPSTTAYVFEWSGVVTSSPVDQAPAGGNGSTSPWSSNSTGTLSQASEVAFGIAGQYNGAATLTGPASPWTNEAQLTSGIIAMIAGYQQVSATTALTYSGTVSAGPISWEACIATLKLASGTAHNDTAALTLSDTRSNTLTHGHNPTSALALAPARANVIAYGKNPKLVLAPVLAAVPSGGSQRKGGPDRHRWWKP